MQVSINYPWGNHRTASNEILQSPGWDFGAPPSMGTAYWKNHIREDLQLFSRLGISAVRFAILFNGLMYGTGNEIPSSSNTSGPWEFIPVRLSNRFLDDFRRLVITFGSVQNRSPFIRLMPVLLGFEFIEDPYVSKPTRIPDPENPRSNDFADFFSPPAGPNRIRYSAGRRGTALSRNRFLTRNVSYSQLFLSEVLERLLREFDAGQPLANYRYVIHSWDLCGEPEGITPPPGQNPNPRLPVANRDMEAYLIDGINLTHRYGFEATIGFRYMQTMVDWGWQLPPHLQQFHTYDGETLPIVTPNAPALIGEAATTENSPFDHEIRYSAPTLLDRLLWFEAKGYREVFLWSAGRASADNRHSWTRHEWDQIYRFTHRQHNENRFRPINRYLRAR